MGKRAGLGDNLYVGAYDLSGDTGSASGGGGPAPMPVTGIDKSAHERIGGVKDGRLEWQAWFNATAGRAHPVLSTLPRTDVIATYAFGTTLGAQAASMVAKQVNYDPTRAQDGTLTLGVSCQSNGYGLDMGRLLTAGQRTDTAATNGSSVDHAASSAHGLQAFLHVFAFTGTDATVKIQESSDDGATDAWADVTGGSFTQVTGATSERIQTARGLTVERYLRVVTTTSAGFTELVFAVAVAKNTVAVTF
ncbi:hypothetical protein [Actinokineospora sp. UTMC 2448]|uniref:hypothetical protein n=1 Tax=Actinokineospora sp. UTMC 2448 TaxID=2268449 RepID=UPI002164C5C2|nr:hypothetical protein [Actinokineospora sp. UTMC 2448]UVS81846.1 hypothetical protein Actkin_05610 [Actinokineospora sp. UTMC 2448]